MTPDPIKQRIVELVPEIGIKCDCDYCKVHRPVDMPATQVRPITLADVLRAIGKSYSITFAIDAQGAFEWRTFMNRTVLIRPAGITWNLALTYDDQLQPVKDFIGKLLNV